MLSLASKFFTGIALAAIVAAVVYGLIAGDDQGGSTLFFVVAASATIAALVAFAFVGADVALDEPVAGADTSAGPVSAATVDGPVPTRPTAPSPWPLLAALSAALLFVGAATGTTLILIGILAVIVVLFGWLAQAWQEHRSWRPSLTERLSDRVIVPVGLPGMVILFVGIGVIALSRVLLAVSAEVAPAIGLVAAVAILGGCAFVASRPAMGSNALVLLSVLGIVAVIGSGIGGAVAGERDVHHADKSAAGHDADREEADGDGAHEEDGGGSEGEADGLTVVATVIEFDADRIELPADTAVKMVFDNKGKGAPHNIAIYPDDTAGTPLFRGDITTGPKKITYDIPAIPAGEYFFRCDVHPTQMTGTVVVAGGSPAGESGADAGGSGSA